MNENKYIIFTNDIDIYSFVTEYCKKEEHDLHGPTILLIPEHDLWFECVRLTKEEITAAKSIMEGVIEKMGCKRGRTKSSSGEDKKEEEEEEEEGRLNKKHKTN